MEERGSQERKLNGTAGQRKSHIGELLDRSQQEGQWPGRTRGLESSWVQEDSVTPSFYLD